MIFGHGFFSTEAGSLLQVYVPSIHVAPFLKDDAELTTGHKVNCMPEATQWPIYREESETLLLIQKGHCDIPADRRPSRDLVSALHQFNRTNGSPSSATDRNWTAFKVRSTWL